MIMTIDQSGRITAIYDDALAALLDEGRAGVRRASAVEPAPGGGWQADLAAVNGPVLSGFRLRSEALAAEVSWLERNVLGDSQ